MHRNNLFYSQNFPAIMYKIMFVSLMALCMAACSMLKSDLTVQPGKQFELGGNQNGSFAVQVENRGNVPVTITERKAGGENISLGVFEPGAQQTIRFSAGSAAVVTNESKKPARLFLTVSGDKNLSMSERNP
ncbi:MAG TPA: hypothetical protein VEY06_05155 [Flavisolibacter sp.]|nr:hypothetical protein [Flavisolibacter sp.]